MKCSFCSEAAEFKCACEQPFMCQSHLLDHIKLNKSHPYEDLYIVLEEHRHKQLSFNIIKILEKLNSARLELISKSKSIIILTEKLHQESLVQLDNLKNICTIILSKKKFFDSEVQNIEKLESMKIDFKSLNIEDLKIQTQKFYSQEFITEFKKFDYIEKKFLESHSLGFECGALSGDGQLLVIGGLDSTIRVWDFIKNKQKFILFGHNRHVTCVGLTRDSKHILSGSFDNTVRIWSIRSRKQDAILKGHKNQVQDICYLDERSLIFSSDFKGEIIIWDFTKYSLLRKLNFTEGIYCFALINTSERLIISLKSKVVIAEMETGEIVKILEKNKSTAQSICLTKDYTKMVSGYDYGLITVWDLVLFKIIFEIKGHSDIIKCIALSSDENFLVSGSSDKTIRVWSMQNGKEIKKIDLISYAKITLNLNQKFYVVFDNSCIGELDTSNLILKVSQYLMPFNYRSVSHSAESKLIAYGIENKLIIWDTEIEAIKYSLLGDNHRIWCVEISSYGELAISISSGSKNIYLWDLKNGNKIAELYGHQSYISCISISADGLRAASGSYDSGVRIWNLKYKKQEYEFKGCTGIIRSIKLIEKKQLLVSAIDSGEIIIWNLYNKTQYAILIGHSQWVFKFILIDDEKYIISAAHDEGIFIWDVREKRLELKFFYQNESLNWLNEKDISVESLKEFLKP